MRGRARRLRRPDVVHICRHEIAVPVEMHAPSIRSASWTGGASVRRVPSWSACGGGKRPMARRRGRERRRPDRSHRIESGPGAPRGRGILARRVQVQAGCRPVRAGWIALPAAGAASVRALSTGIPPGCDIRVNWPSHSCDTQPPPRESSLALSTGFRLPRPGTTLAHGIVPAPCRGMAEN